MTRTSVANEIITMLESEIELANKKANERPSYEVVYFTTQKVALILALRKAEAIIAKNEVSE